MARETGELKKDRRRQSGNGNNGMDRRRASGGLEPRRGRVGAAGRTQTLRNTEQQLSKTPSPSHGTSNTGHRTTRRSLSHYPGTGGIAAPQFADRLAGPRPRSGSAWAARRSCGSPAAAALAARRGRDGPGSRRCAAGRRWAGRRSGAGAGSWAGAWRTRWRRS